MAIDANALKAFIKSEVALISDARVTAHIRALLVEPTPILLDWDYGAKGEQHVCWAVTGGIVYCESGFGPRTPWGLIFGLKDRKNASMGMDSGWFTTFLQAYFEADAAELPIWRVFKTDSSGTRLPISGEGAWDETWKQVMQHRKDDPINRYNCDTSIVYERI
jgi:hypothetical protein